MSSTGNADLSFIKTSNTGTGTVEVHIAYRGPHFGMRVLVTGSTFGEETDGSWAFVDFNGDGVLDLASIKTQNTPTRLVEVHKLSHLKTV